MKPKEKLKEFPMTPLSPDEINIRASKIADIAKRIPRATRDLEVESLDMILYLDALSKGKFPASHLEATGSSLERAHTELGRILKVWNEVFDKEIKEKHGIANP